MLEGEAKLVYHILFCMDGNDSLKCIMWSVQKTNLEDDELAQSAEREDSRKDSLDYFLTRETVDKWASDVVDKIVGDASPPVHLLLRVLTTTDASL